MPGKDVDHASLTKDREADLGLCRPALVASESARYVLMHGRMTSAQQATEVGTVPVNRQVKARAEHLRYRLEFDEAQGPRSALDLTDQTP